MRSRDPVPLLLLKTLPQGDDKARAVRAMFDTIAPRYDLVNRIMTFGLDRRWRRTAVAALDLPPGSRVLDLACGTGDLCMEVGSRGSIALGLDVSMGMLHHARAAAPLLQGDAVRLPFRHASLDGAISGFALRNFVELGPVFAELARVLRPGGRLSLLDVSSPANPVLRAGHSVYFGHVVPRIGAVLSDRDAYRYLPESVVYLPEGDVMMEMLRDAGFADVGRRALSGGITQLITGARA